MKTAAELERFTAYAKGQGMELAGDGLRFYNPETATAWTKWLAEAKAFERELEDDGQTAPRVTPADIEANIVDECYFNAAHAIAYNAGGPTVVPPAPTALLTFCVLVLRNGFTVTGESACVSPEAFNAEIGRKIARENAVQKVWPLLGFLLKEQLFQRTQPAE